MDKTRELLTGFFDATRTQIAAVAATYNLAVALYLILHFTLGERWSFIGFSNNGAHIITAASFIMLVLTLLTAHYRLYWMLLAIPGCLAFLIWYGPYFLPKDSPAATETVSVLTYNVGSSLFDSGAGDIPGQVRTIFEGDADLVALQESGETLVSELEGAYPHMVSERELTLLSNYPIVADSTDVITGGPSGFFSHPVALRNLVDIDGQQVAVYVVHLVRPRSQLAFLDYDPFERNEATEVIIEAVQAETAPVILLCDCNMSDRTDDYQAYDRLLDDAWRVAGTGLGFTAPVDNPFPITRTDYIWLDERFTPTSVQVINSTSSDHFPVRATISLRD